jgi:phosphohistidine phosphatase
MNLYVVRHGKAAKGGKDRLRPLTRRGIRETHAAAEFLKRLRAQPEAIWHSDRVRAIETARILEALHPKDGVIQQKNMGPDDSVGPLIRLIDRTASDVMIVGHLPHLGKLVAKLVDAKKSDEILRFPPSTVVILTDQERKWSIEAVIPPSVFRIEPRSR